MAVIGYAKELVAARSAVESMSQLELKRRYLVEVDSKHDGPLIVMNAPLLPQLYEAWQTGSEIIPEARVVSREPKQSDRSPFVWFVDVTYSTDSELSPNSTSPTTELPQITLDFEQYREVIPGEIDQIGGGQNSPEDMKNGIIVWKSGIRNSAGEAYVPFPEREAARPVVTYQRNELNTTVAVCEKFINSVNKTTWSGLQPRQALLRGIRAQSQYMKIGSSDIVYYSVEYVFVLKRESWDLQLLDHGRYYLKYNQNNNDYSRIPFTNEDKTPRLGLLDHSDAQKPGQRLGDNATAQFNRYRIYKEEDFNELGIFLNLTLAQQRRPRRGAA
jgi:hypothetical protein